MFAYLPSAKRPRAVVTATPLLIAALWIGSAAAAGPLYMSAAWNEHTYRHTNRRHHPPASGVSGGGNPRTVQPASYRTYRQPYRRKDYSSKVMDLETFEREKPRARIWKANLKNRRPGRYSWTSRIVMANVICYIIQSFWPRFTQMGVKLSDKILRGEQLYRLMTPVFLHGGIGHLCMNMFSLRNMGNNVEQLFGPGRFLFTYLLAGVAGNLASAINSPNPALGASGAIFGIVGAQLVFLSRNDWLLGRAGESMQGALMQTILINVFIGMMNPMVDNWGHIGGLVGGAAAAYYFGPRLYLMSLPEGGSFVVDKPVFRLPRKVESIPENIARKFAGLTERFRINPSASQNPDKPWRNPTTNYGQRQSVPNRSIKPKRFW